AGGVPASGRGGDPIWVVETGLGADPARDGRGRVGSDAPAARRGLARVPGPGSLPEAAEPETAAPYPSGRHASLLRDLRPGLPGGGRAAVLGRRSDRLGNRVHCVSISKEELAKCQIFPKRTSHVPDSCPRFPV